MKLDSKALAAATRGWPKGLVAIAEVLGPERALALAKAFGHGDPVYVPKRPVERHPWRAVLTKEEFDAMVEAFGGTRIEIPRGTFVAPKKLAILRLIRQGELSTREIAAEVGCAGRYVRRIFRNEVSE